MGRPPFVRIAAAAGVLLVVLLVLAQLVPVAGLGRNPPVVAEPVWNSAATRELAVSACYDCHSNETRWPWYSRVAPASWLTARHVVDGREALNFSRWGVQEQEAEEIAETIREGSMPPRDYRLLHPVARLDVAERDALIAGLRASLGDPVRRDDD